MRIAMWSGPRNLSTALMYSFAQRQDCAASDEPFYAAYLAQTKIEHPMRSEILTSGETDPLRVSEALLGAPPGGLTHWYQKHMAHHMLPGFPRSWMREVTNVVLLRHPARVVASYAKKREGPSLADIGFEALAAIFDDISKFGNPPLVIDSADVRAAPEAALRMLCNGIGLDFDPAMLSWPAGGNAADGVWARHWYGAVHRSTGFDTAEGPLPKLDGHYGALVEAALPFYERLSEHAVKVAPV